jgi:hypothetical protein
MIIHREIERIYHHKPIVQGVIYSPLMVESKVKEERCTEAIPIAVPPPIFLRRLAVAFVLCFSCFSAASSREHTGEHFYSWF